jgi:hypothetical protein
LEAENLMPTFVGRYEINQPVRGAPVGLLSWERVTEDPTNRIDRPAGAIAYLGDGTAAWISTDGTAAGWSRINVWVPAPGLGTIAAQDADNVAITGGSVDNLGLLGLQDPGNLGLLRLVSQSSAPMMIDRMLIFDVVDGTRTLKLPDDATVSGLNTGDQDLSGLVPNTRTVNGAPLSADVTLTTANVADSVDARYCTDAEKIVIGNTSGVNTGDQDLSGYVTTASESYVFVMPGQASGTTGLFGKVGGTSQGQITMPTTTNSNNDGNGGLDPYLVTTARTITTAYVHLRQVAIDPGLPIGAAPVARFDVYTHAYSARTKVGEISVPIDPAKCGYNNSIGTDYTQFVVVTGLSIALSAGSVFGLEFVNVTGNNQKINAIGRVKIILKTS